MPTQPEGFREPDYLAWVRRLPCCACEPGVAAKPWESLSASPKVSDPDHLPTPDKALGRKSPDAFVVPLCRGHHERRAREYRRPTGLWETQDERGRPVTIDLWYVVARLRWAYEHPPAFMSMG